jgi:hypothetical protein
MTDRRFDRARIDAEQVVDLLAGSVRPGPATVWLRRTPGAPS